MKIMLLESGGEQCVHFQKLHGYFAASYVQDSQIVLFLSIGSRLVPHSLLEWVALIIDGYAYS